MTNSRFGKWILSTSASAIVAGAAWAETPAETTRPPLPPTGLTPTRSAQPIRPVNVQATAGAARPITVSSPGAVQRLGQPIANPITVGPKVDTNSINPNALVWDARQKEYNVKAGESEAKFTFAFTNATSAEVTLQRVQTSCGCTAAKLPMEPWVIPAGGRGDINVVMDVRGKYGTVTKTATVYTSAGPFPLMVKSIIPQQTANDATRPMGDRSRNLQIAAADRQAALRGDCASCHVTPAIGKTGKALFDAACGVCHTAEHRASFVPDLARLNKPTDMNYWVTWITNGREGSLMPAFHQTKGGFLNDSQIQSLATYLETEFKLESALNPGAPKIVVQPPAPLAPATK